MATEASMTEDSKHTTSLDSTFPCELPETPELFLSPADFEQHVSKTFADIRSKREIEDGEAKLAELSVGQAATGKPFMDALLEATPRPKMTDAEAALEREGKMLTTNMDVAYKDTGSTLLDLFTELERVVGDGRLRTLLDAAWKEDPLATLKIIWNARSIHLGKGEQESFYKCLGWMKNDHPTTVLANLPWLYRPVIEKKAREKEENDEDEDAMVLVDPEGDDSPDVLYGVAHGYWKDLLNILVLAVNGHLDISGKLHNVLHQPRAARTRQRLEVRKRQRRLKRKLEDRVSSPHVAATEAANAASTSPNETVEQDEATARNKRHAREREQHQNALRRFEDPFYRCLHATVGRLFAQQLRADKEALDSGDPHRMSRISLAAKWAPSLKGFHDKHTMIATSIAEILFPRDHLVFASAALEGVNDDRDGCKGWQRETYLRRAREAYRAQYLTPLRRHLDVVERKISARALDTIIYSRVPSLAMDAYKELFATKDSERYVAYLEKVASGKARISGVVLTPGSLVHQVLSPNQHFGSRRRRRGLGGNSNGGSSTADRLLEDKTREMLNKALDGQWATLVRRIKESGTLASTIAVCDVSGSMGWPRFGDGTRPIDHSIGLALLIAEASPAPFGGCFITFSRDPAVRRVRVGDSFATKVRAMNRSDWGANTDFAAVFERLLLPMAQEHDVRPEDMVRQIIVLSDMHFDSAYSIGGGGAHAWESSFERIKRKYAEAGYEAPRLVFWNLAGGGQGGYGAAPKPTAADERGVTMVSGYSQGMLKMFLEGGGFDDVGVVGEEEEIEEVVKTEDGEVVTRTVKKKSEKEADPMDGLRKAIGHKAYDILKVVD